MLRHFALFFCRFFICAPVLEARARHTHTEANKLFVETVTLYRQSDSFSESDKAEAYQKVRALFDQILNNHPDSRLAKAIAKGGSPGGVVLADLPAVDCQKSQQSALQWYQVVVPGGAVGKGCTFGQFPSKTGKTHAGEDIDGGCHLEFRYAADGTVTRVIKEGDQDFCAVGNAIIIGHGVHFERQTFTIYHLLQDASEFALCTMAQGQRLGVTGKTGASDWCHLHFEVRHLRGIRNPYFPEWRNIYGDGDWTANGTFRSN